MLVWVRTVPYHAKLVMYQNGTYLVTSYVISYFVFNELVNILPYKKPGKDHGLFFHLHLYMSNDPI